MYTLHSIYIYIYVLRILYRYMFFRVDPECASAIWHTQYRHLLFTSGRSAQVQFYLSYIYVQYIYIYVLYLCVILYNLRSEGPSIFLYIYNIIFNI